MNKISFFVSIQSSKGKQIKRFKTQNNWWNIIALLLSSAIIAVVSLLLAIGMFDVELFYDFFRKPLLFLLNYLPILFFQIILCCVFNRQWLAFFITAIIVLGSSAGNFYKLKFRSEPFSFADIPMIRAGLSIAGEFDLTPNLRLIMAVFVIVIGTIFLAIFVRGKIRLKQRLYGIVLISVCSAFLWRSVYSSGELYYGSATSNEHVVANWTQQEYAAKGFIYPFLYSIADSGDHKVNNSTLDAFLTSEIQEDERADIIMFQLEAFNDLRRLGINGIADDTYSIYDDIKKDGICGTLLVNVFAGGTIDTEHRVLTGESSYRSIKGSTDSFVGWLAAQGYYTTGNHPNSGSFYNRRNVNAYLGFKEYFFNEELFEDLIKDLYPSPWFSDRLLFPQVQMQLNQLYKNQEHIFSFNVSMQGHSPYNTECFLYEKEYFDGSGYSDETNYLINNYLGSVVDTQEQLMWFINKIKDVERPSIVVIYGDHKPWLGDGNSAATELEINLNHGTEEGLLNRYSTEYVIWANNEARKMFNNSFTGTGETIHAEELFPTLINLMT